MERKGKKTSERQRKWEEKVDRAKRVRASWRDLFHIDKARDYFDGKQNPGMPKDEWVTINKFYSHLKAQLPSLYNQNPYFYVKVSKCYKPDPLLIVAYEKKGKIRQAMLNYLKEELELKEKARLAIQDAHFAYGVIKIHYTSELKDNPNAGQPVFSEDTEEPLLGDDGEIIMEPDTIPVNERYNITRVHPDDFLWDEDAGPLKDNWKWVAQRVEMTLKELKSDKRFSGSNLKQFDDRTGISLDNEQKAREERKKGDVTGQGSFDDDYHKKNRSDTETIVCLWEIYDLIEKKWTVIAEDAEYPLIDSEDIPKGIEGHPFSILRFTLRDDSPYPIPPMSQGLDVCAEYNLSRSRLLTHRKRFNRKYEANINALVDPDDELSKLETGDDGAIIRVMQTGAIQPIKDAPLDQQSLIEIGYLQKDIGEMFGNTTQESVGVAGSDSATEAGILEKRLAIREGDAMGQVMDFVKVIARKLDQLVQTHITEDQAVRVAGPQGEMWEIVRTDDYEAIEGEYEYSVNVGATIPQLPQMERNSWMAFLTLLQGFPHLLTNKRLLQQMAEMHHIEDDAMIDDLFKLGQQIMGGQVPMPGQSGSQPGQSETNPVGASAGQPAGFGSMNQPGGGNIDA